MGQEIGERWPTNYQQPINQQPLESGRLTTILNSTRDVSARNCLVGDNLVVKLSDFGMSRETAGQGKNYYKKVGSCQCLSGATHPITNWGM